MGYHAMKTEEVYEILRRHASGQSVSEISRNLELDRKTVRKYIGHGKRLGIISRLGTEERDENMRILRGLIQNTTRKRPLFEELEPYEEEVKELITTPRNPMKPKTAYECIRERYGLKGSYETFKIFCRVRNIRKTSRKVPIRIETAPGEEIQIDYGKAGLKNDKITEKNRVVHGYIMQMCHSRKPFIQFVYSQTKESFCESFMDGLEYYGGAPERCIIDNLKAGILKADIYDPRYNRTFSELAEHYGVFIDPARVAKGDDKGKVERLVPVMRELFRKLIYIHPDASLQELNRYAREWCTEEYGNRPHGTTGLPPEDLFQNTEKESLKKLPGERFELTYWRQAKVHPDQFIQFEKKRYGVPAKYRGETVWVKRQGKMVYIYHNHELIKQYVVSGRKYAYDPNDFPDVKREMMEGTYPGYLVRTAGKYGKNAQDLVKIILQPKAYLNARRALGVLDLMKKHYEEDYFDRICRTAVENRVKNPRVIRQMFKDEEDQMEMDFSVPSISDQGNKMIRNTDYYFDRR